MKLKFTRKTWYFLLLASAAASMLNGFAVLSGTSFSLIEQIAFAAAGIAALFLAAEKGSASWEKRNFTGVFVLLMVSYMVNGWAGYLCSALAWPLLLSTEYKRGMADGRRRGSGPRHCGDSSAGECGHAGSGLFADKRRICAHGDEHTVHVGRLSRLGRGDGGVSFSHYRRGVRVYDGV